MKEVRQRSLLLDRTSWALFDAGPEQRYRYELGRVWDERAAIATFIMLNPSTADAFVDDPTIRKCCGFARAWGRGGIRVVNLFAFRSSSPRALLGTRNPIGPENAEALNRAFGEARAEVVCAWGAFKHPELERQEELVKMLAFDARVPLVCLRLTAAGRPEHPLYVPYNIELRSWASG